MYKNLAFRIAAVLLAAALLSTGLAAQTRKAAPKRPKAPTVSPVENFDADMRQMSFDIAWTTLRTSYFDKTFSGLDWNAVRKEYEPKVAASRSDAEFHQILTQMLARLGKSHLAVIVPEYFEQLEAAKKEAYVRENRLAREKGLNGGSSDDADAFDEEEDTAETVESTKRYGIGVEIRMLGDQIVITRVDKRSGATIAGLKPGFVIRSINGIDVSDVISQATIAGATTADIKYFLPMEIESSFLNGSKDSSVFITGLDAQDKPVEFVVPRLELEGDAISISKDLPEQFLRFESSLLSKDVGYIRFNAFAVPVIEKVCTALTELADKKALIIDLRGNLGGILGSMIGLTGMMTDKQVSLGQYVSREGSGPFTTESKAKNFKGKIVILVDRTSMSAAELFAAGLQGNHRALVVGERTAGQALPASWMRLPTGAVMMYPVANFITPRGVSLEGKGLEPDITVALDRRSLLAGQDVQLQRAIDAATNDTIKPAEAKPAALNGVSVITSAGPPPPPPPAARSRNGIASPPPPRTSRAASKRPVRNDLRAAGIVRDFAAAVGAADAIKGITSYEVQGALTTQISQLSSHGTYYAARQFPDKYVTVSTTAQMGETRMIVNEKGTITQSDFGIESSVDGKRDLTRIEHFGPMFMVLQPGFLRDLKFEGQYEVEGAMMKVLSARDPNGSDTGLTFDAKTGLLKTLTIGGVLLNFNDYRKTDGFLVPWEIEMDGIFHVRATRVTINNKLDPTLFERKEKCFDKAN